MTDRQPIYLPAVRDSSPGGSAAAAARPPAPSRPAPPAGLSDSPVWACADQHSLWGRIPTDPREIAEIAARIEAIRGRERRRAQLVCDVAAAVGSVAYDMAVGALLVAFGAGWLR